MPETPPPDLNVTPTTVQPPATRDPGAAGLNTLLDQLNNQRYPRQALPPAKDFFQIERAGTDGYAAFGRDTQAGQGWDRFYARGDKASPKTGWKIHVSATTPEAQQALAELAMKHGIFDFKFGDIATFQQEGYRQAGKTAVFYHTEIGSNGQRIDWARFAQEAEVIVQKHGGPGHSVMNDRPMRGTQSVFYRNDLGVEGDLDREGKPRYIDYHEIEEYAKRNNIPADQIHNLGGRPDPFQDIEVRVPRNITPVEVRPATAYDPLRAAAERGWVVQGTNGPGGGKTATLAVFGNNADLDAVARQLTDRGINFERTQHKGKNIIRIADADVPRVGEMLPQSWKANNPLFERALTSPTGRTTGVTEFTPARPVVDAPAPAPAAPARTAPFAEVDPASLRIPATSGLAAAIQNNRSTSNVYSNGTRNISIVYAYDASSPNFGGVTDPAFRDPAFRNQMNAQLLDLLQQAERHTGNRAQVRGLMIVDSKGGFGMATGAAGIQIDQADLARLAEAIKSGNPTKIAEARAHIGSSFAHEMVHLSRDEGTGFAQNRLEIPTHVVQYLFDPKNNAQFKQNLQNFFDSNIRDRTLGEMSTQANHYPRETFMSALIVADELQKLSPEFKAAWEADTSPNKRDSLLRMSEFIDSNIQAKLNETLIPQMMEGGPGKTPLEALEARATRIYEAQPMNTGRGYTPLPDTRTPVEQIRKALGPQSTGQSEAQVRAEYSRVLDQAMQKAPPELRAIIEATPNEAIRANFVESYVQAIRNPDGTLGTPEANAAKVEAAFKEFHDATKNPEAFTRRIEAFRSAAAAAAPATTAGARPAEPAPPSRPSIVDSPDPLRTAADNRQIAQVKRKGVNVPEIAIIGEPAELEAVRKQLADRGITAREAEYNGRKVLMVDTIDPKVSEMLPESWKQRNPAFEQTRAAAGRAAPAVTPPAGTPPVATPPAEQPGTRPNNPPITPQELAEERVRAQQEFESANQRRAANGDPLLPQPEISDERLRARINHRRNAPEFFNEDGRVVVEPRRVAPEPPAARPPVVEPAPRPAAPAPGAPVAETPGAPRPAAPAPGAPVADTPGAPRPGAPTPGAPVAEPPAVAPGATLGGTRPPSRYQGAIDSLDRSSGRLHTVNRPLNWAMMLAGGKGLWDQAQSGQLNTLHGAEAGTMFGAGLAGEVGSFVGKSGAGMPWSELTTRSQRTGAVLRGTAVAAAPLIVKDGATDILHSFGYHTSEADRQATQDRQRREDASGTGFFYGVGNARTHDAFRGTTKVIAGAEGTYIVGRTAVQAGRSLFVRQAEKQIAKTVVKAAGTRLVGAAAGAFIPGVNIIMAADMAADLAVSAAERHTEEGLNAMNAGVAAWHNVRTRLPAASAGTIEMWREVGDIRDLDATRASYRTRIQTDGIPDDKMDAYVTTLAQKRAYEQGIANLEARKNAEQDPTAKAAIERQQAELRTGLTTITERANGMGAQLREERNRTVTEQINNNPNLNATQKAEQLARVQQDTDYLLSPRRVDELVTINRQLQRAETRVAADNVAFGTRERSVEILSQYPNIYTPLRNSGLLDQMDAATLSGTRTYTDTDGTQRTYATGGEIRSRISQRQNQLADEINALEASLNNGPMGGFSQPGLGHSAHSSAMGYEGGNTAYNDAVTHMIHGYADNSYSTALGRLEEYRRKLRESGKVTDNSPEGIALRQADQAVEKIRLMYQLEQASKELDKSGIVQIDEMGADGKPTGRKISYPSFTSMVEMNRAAHAARDREVASQTAAAEGQYQALVRAAEPFDIDRELDRSVDQARDFVGPNNYLTNNNATPETAEELQIALARQNGLLTDEQVDEARQQLNTEIETIRSQIANDPEFQTARNELEAINRETAPLKEQLPALIKKAEMEFAKNKEQDLRQELQALNAQPPQPGNEAAYNAQKAALQQKLTNIQGQITSGNITDPEVRRAATDYVVNPNSLNDARELQTQLTAAIKDAEDKAKAGQPADPSLPAMRQQLERVQRLTTGDMANDVTRTQGLLQRKTELEGRLNQVRDRVYQRAQTDINAATARVTANLSQTAGTALQEYQKQNEDLYKKISDPNAPPLNDEQRQQAQPLLNTLTTARREYAQATRALGSGEPTPQQLAQVQTTQMRLMRAERAYYESIDQAQQQNKAAGVAGPAADSPEAKRRNIIAFENSSFNTWATEASKVAKSPRGREGVSELIALRQELLAARTDGSLAGVNNANPLQGQQRLFDIKERAAQAMAKLTTEERQALQRVNAEFDRELANIPGPDTREERTYRALDNLARGSQDQLAVSQAAENAIWDKEHLLHYRDRTEWSRRDVRDVPGEWSPANEELAREMVRQLEDSGRTTEAQALIAAAKEKWDVDLNAAPDLEEGRERLAEEGLIMVPTLSPQQGPNFAAYQAENNYAVLQQLYDPNAPQNSYRPVTEAEAAQKFKDDVERRGFDAAYESLKLYNGGKFVGADGMPTADGRAFLERVGQLSGEQSMSFSRPMSADATAMIANWREAGSVNLGEYNAKNRAAVLEILENQIKEGKTDNVESMIKTINENPSWRREGVLDPEKLARSGNNGLAVMMLEREARELAGTTRTEDVTEAEFNAEKLRASRALQERVERINGRMNTLNNGLTAKGVPVTPLSPESQRRMNELRQNAFDQVMSANKAVVEGKALERTEVDVVNARYATDEYKPKDPNEPNISTDERNQRIADNAALERSKTYELTEARQRDADSVRAATVQQAVELRDTLRNMNGNPQMRVNDEQKETMRRMAAALYEEGRGDKEGLRDFIQTVERGTGYRIPEDEIVRTVDARTRASTPPVITTPAASTPAMSSPAASAPSASTPTTSSPAASAPATSSPSASPAASSPSVSGVTTSVPTPSAATPTSPTASSPTTSSPAASAPATSSPRASSPTTSSPAASAPATSSPRASSPTTSSPAASAPATSSPRASSPTTSSPAASAPATSPPRASSPTTSSPAASAPATSSPRASSPTTSSPAASAPATSSPRASSPTTSSPAASAPATSSPRASSPTTSSPAASSPATSSPTASRPVAAQPSTPAPTMSRPATPAPTTSSPSASSPSTSRPATTRPGASMPPRTQPRQPAPGAPNLQELGAQSASRIQEILSGGINANSADQIADVIRNFANAAGNMLGERNRQAILAAADRVDAMNPVQLQQMLGQRLDRTGKTMADMLVSSNPREQAMGVLTMIYSNNNSSPQQTQQQQPQQSQPQQQQPQQQQQQPQQQQPQQQQQRPRGGNPAQEYMDALAQGDAQKAGAALKAFAQQQMAAARRSNNPALAQTAAINMKAADALSGPNGQDKLNRLLDSKLDRDNPQSRTVGEMLESRNPNTRNLVGALVANEFAAPGTERFAHNNRQGLKMADQMERIMGANIPVGMNVPGINGGQNANQAQGPAVNGGNRSGQTNQR